MNLSRSRTLYKGFYESFISRALIACMQFFITGVVCRHLGAKSFGIWMLISQCFIIISVLDLGIGGGGLRNQLAQLNAQNHIDQRELFLSSFFFVLYSSMSLILFLPLGLLFLPKIVLFPLVFIIIRLPFSLYGTGFLAYQELSKKAWCEVFEVLIFLLSIYILVKTHISDYLFFLFSFFVLSLSVVFSFQFFLKTRNWSFKWISFSKIGSLLKPRFKINLQFWLLNLFSLGLFSLCPFIVNGLLGLEKAGEFCLFQRVVALILGVHFLAINALWSGFSDAFYRNDIPWMKRYFKKGVLGTVFCFSFAGIVLSIFHSPLFFLWTGKTIQNTPLALLFSLSSFIYGLVNIFSVLLNSQNLIKNQITFLCVGFIINLFFGVILGRMYGEIGVLFAFTLSLSPLLISDILEVKALTIWTYEKKKNTNY